jgi:hypothetical protein
MTDFCVFFEGKWMSGPRRPESLSRIVKQTKPNAAVYPDVANWARVYRKGCDNGEPVGISMEGRNAYSILALFLEERKKTEWRVVLEGTDGSEKKEN